MLMNQEQLTIEAISGQGELCAMPENYLPVVVPGAREQLERRIQENIQKGLQKKVLEELGAITYSFAYWFVRYCVEEYCFDKKGFDDLSNPDMLHLEGMIYEKMQHKHKRNKVRAFLLMPIILGLFMALGTYGIGSPHYYISKRSCLQRICGDDWFPYDTVREAIDRRFQE